MVWSQRVTGITFNLATELSEEKKNSFYEYDIQTFVVVNPFLDIWT